MSFSLKAALPSSWVYLHYPVCQHHCSYCDFNVVSRATAPEHFENQWLESLQKHFSALKGKEKVKLSSLYLGGGTPSLVSLETWKEVFRSLKEIYDWTDETEITIECNPENITEEYLLGLKNLGVTRPSFGVQTTLPAQLRRLERLSTAKNISNSIEWASKIFKNFSLDFMIGIPDQTLESLEADLKFIQSVQPPHLSVYLLTLDEQHKMKTNPAIQFRLATPELASQLYERVCESLKSLGYLHYEVSNFAKPGFESRHNSNYWNANSDYFGFGPGAHGYVKTESGDRIRYENFKDLLTWSKDETGISGFEGLSIDQQKMERLYLALRSRKPLEAKGFSSAKVRALQNEGLLQNDAEQIVLTEKGWLLMEGVAAQLLF